MYCKCTNILGTPKTKRTRRANTRQSGTGWRDCHGMQLWTAALSASQKVGGGGETYLTMNHERPPPTPASRWLLIFFFFFLVSTRTRGLDACGPKRRGLSGANPTTNYQVPFPTPSSSTMLFYDLHAAVHGMVTQVRKRAPRQITSRPGAMIHGPAPDSIDWILSIL